MAPRGRVSAEEEERHKGRSQEELQSRNLGFKKHDVDDALQGIQRDDFLLDMEDLTGEIDDAGRAILMANTDDQAR